MGEHDVLTTNVMIKHFTDLPETISETLISSNFLQKMSQKSCYKSRSHCLADSYRVDSNLARP